MALSATLTGTIALFTAMAAQAQLHGLGEDSAPEIPDPFFAAVARASWQFDQAHRRAVVALYCAKLVLAGLLFFASVRVVLRVPSAGKLWRQAITAACLCATSAIIAERAFGADRLAIVRAQLRALPVLPAFLHPMSLDDAARSIAAGSASGPTVVLGILLGILIFAGRNRTRARIG